MNAAPSRLTGKAAALRAAFDRGFAEPVQLETIAREPVLAVRVDAQPFAIRLSEISGLFADKKITPVPGSHPALLGIAGFRGAIVPIYDLQMLLRLDDAPTARAAASRWLVVAAAAPVGLAFTAFEGRFRARRDAILPQPAGAQMRSYAREFVRSRKFVGPLMHVGSILETINATQVEAAPKEDK